MATIKFRRTAKRGSITVDMEINGGPAMPFETINLLSNIFPGLEVIHGGLGLSQINLRCQGHHKCFAFGSVISLREDSFRELECELNRRLRLIREWVREIPVVEEFTIEI